MKNQTGIEWTNYTWNPFKVETKELQANGKPKSGWFCVPKDEGCSECYASVLNSRFGTGHKYGAHNVKHLNFITKNLTVPQKIKEPSMFFVNSMTDFFLPHYSDEQRFEVLDIIESLPRHRFQILMKYHKEALAFFERTQRPMPDNVWLGVTVAMKKNLDRVNSLIKMPARIKFISAEPLYEDLGEIPHLQFIDQIITGGLSGLSVWKDNPRAMVFQSHTKKWKPKPECIDWIKSIRDQCKENGVAFFHKQWGGPTPKAAGNLVEGITYKELPELP